MKTHIFPLFIKLLLIFGAASAFSASAPRTENLEGTVNHLIQFVAKSGCTFIRNGEPHPAAEASEHLKAKYEHFKNEIKTPEDFIRLAGTKSLVSGKPYMVKIKDAKEIPSADWLTAELETYRKSQKAPEKKD